MLWAFLLSNSFSPPSFKKQNAWKLERAELWKSCKFTAVFRKAQFGWYKMKWMYFLKEENTNTMWWKMKIMRFCLPDFCYLTRMLSFSLTLISLSVERRHTFPRYFIFQTAGFRSEKSPVCLAHWSSFHVLEATHWVFEIVAVRLKTNRLHICRKLKERNLNKYFKGGIK